MVFLLVPHVHCGLVLLMNPLEDRKKDFADSNNKVHWMNLRIDELSEIEKKTFNYQAKPKAN